jgi:hypothetical protein
MTGLEATSELFKFFSENDYFEMGQHFGSVILISDNKELEEACLELGLEEMGEMGVIVKVTKKDKNFWILKKPLTHYDQKVELGANTAMGISVVLNEICDQLENTEDKCDPLSITDKDINNLVSVASKMIEKKS